MRKQIILCLKVAWVVAALAAIFIGSGVCGSTEHACAAAGNATALFMFLMTFPTGIMFLPIALGLDESLSSQSSSDLIVVWSVFAVGGFLQWFYIVPRLLDKPGLTILSLNSEPAPAASASSDSTQPIPATPVADDILPAKTPIRSRAPKQNQIRSFDRLGRSPLERAISRS